MLNREGINKLLYRVLLCMFPHSGGMSKHIVNVCSFSVKQSVSQQQFMSHDVTWRSHEHMEPEGIKYNKRIMNFYKSSTEVNRASCPPTNRDTNTGVVGRLVGLA